MTLRNLILGWICCSASVWAQPPKPPQLAEVYQLFGQSCLNGANKAGTAFRLEGRTELFTSLHTVNGCAIKSAINTIDRNSRSMSLQLCLVSLEFDVAVLDKNCRATYDFAFQQPSITDETLYVIGYPVAAGQFRRPVFVFRHGNSPITQLGELGLHPGIFGRDKEGIGLERGTPVIVIGSGVAPGDSGAPVVTKSNEVVGIVGGGRRESAQGSLVGITWATAIGPLLVKHLAPAGPHDALLRTIARKPVDQFFANDALKQVIKGVEFVEFPIQDATGEGPLRRYWIMTAEATRQEFQDCVNAGSCSDANRVDISKPRLPALVDKFEEAQKFCGWLGGSVLEESVWKVAASLAQASETTTKRGCTLVLKGLPGCEDKQQPVDVRSSRPNSAGLYDMLGNVWEWITTPTGVPSVAGGAFNTPHQDIQCASPNDCKDAIRTKARAGTIGVRCMVPQEQQ